MTSEKTMGDQPQRRDNHAFDQRLPELLEKWKAALTECDSTQAEAVICDVFATLAEHLEQDPSPEDLLSARASQCEERADWQGAEAAYVQMLTLPDRSAAYQAKVHAELAAFYWHILARRAEAFEHARRATEAARRADIDVLVVMTLQGEASYLIGAERIAEARQAIDEATSILTSETLFNQSRASILIMRAECARLSGLLQDAERDLGEAYQLLEPLASIQFAAGIQSDLAAMWAVTARLREDQGDDDAAIAAWYEAVRLYKYVASLSHAASIYARLRVARALNGLAQAVLRQRQQLLSDVGLPAAELQ